MHLSRGVSLLLAAIALALVVMLVAVRALAPTTGPSAVPTGETAASNLLSGTVTGLDLGVSVDLLLEGLADGHEEGRGEILQRWQVFNGRWQQPDLALTPGFYRLVPEAEGYVQVPRSITFQVPSVGLVWRYQDMHFRFLHPEDSVALLGLPLCLGPSSPVVAVTAVPRGEAVLTPLPAPTPAAGPDGLCYANHLASVRLLPAGLQGRVSGLPEGLEATLSLYALPPVPGEHYGQGEPPPAGGSWTYPPEVSRLPENPGVGPGCALVAMLRAGNGPWGLVDPSLAGRKYLVVARVAGQAASPRAYEVVVYAGKAPGFPGGIDFAYVPTNPEPAPVARAVPVTSRTGRAGLAEGNGSAALDPDLALTTVTACNWLCSPYSISHPLAYALQPGISGLEREGGLLASDVILRAGGSVGETGAQAAAAENLAAIAAGRIYPARCRDLQTAIVLSRVRVLGPRPWLEG